MMNPLVKEEEEEKGTRDPEETTPQENLNNNTSSISQSPQTLTQSQSQLGETQFPLFESSQQQTQQEQLIETTVTIPTTAAAPSTPTPPPLPTRTSATNALPTLPAIPTLITQQTQQSPPVAAAAAASVPPPLPPTPSINHPPTTSIINGKGLWRSWQRNFKTPLLALLDLFDNAIDATLVTTLEEHSRFAGKGKIHVFQDTTTTTTTTTDNNSNGSTEPADETSSSTTRTITDGLCIMNNCHSPIPHLQQVLEVYRSTKGHTSIGENGVGTKQACASLTNLSFILTKTTNKNKKSHKLSLGIIAQQLQHDNGICFPHVDIQVPNNNKSSSLHEKNTTPQNLSSILQKELSTIGATNELFRKCFIKYGHGNLQHGIQRIQSHCEKLVLPRPKQEDDHDDDSDCDNDVDGKETSSTAFQHDSHVFLVILHKLRHYGDDEDDKQETTTTTTTTTTPTTSSLSSYGSRTMGMLKLLWRQLPAKYLHIPPCMEIRINGHKLPFQYWERRLVALTSFQVPIDTTKSYKRTSHEWSTSATSSKGTTTNAAVSSSNGSTQDESKRTIFIHLGFAPHRFENDKDGGESESENEYTTNMKTTNNKQKDNSNTAAMLCIYSRRSGRLIRQYDDARSKLKLNFSSSNFGQGLTILIDDFFGTIPLNPTKQDFGFNQEKTGKIHEENIFAWIGAYAYTYWTYHFKQYHEKKSILTDMVKSTLPAIQKLKKQNDIVPLTRGTFTTFENVHWMLTRAGNIRKSKHIWKRTVGKDSRVDLPPYTNANTNTNANMNTNTNTNTNTTPTGLITSSSFTTTLQAGHERLLMEMGEAQTNNQFRQQQQQQQQEPPPPQTEPITSSSSSSSAMIASVLHNESVEPDSDFVMDNNDSNGYGTASVQSDHQVLTKQETETTRQTFQIPRKKGNTTSGTAVISNNGMTTGKANSKSKSTNGDVIELLSDDDSEEDDGSTDIQPPIQVSEPRVFETRHHEGRQEEAEEGEVNDCIQQQYEKRGHLLHVGQQAIHRLRTDIIQERNRNPHDYQHYNGASAGVTPCETFLDEFAELRKEVHELQNTVRELNRDLYNRNHRVNKLKDEIQSQKDQLCDLDKYVERLVRERSQLAHRLKQWEQSDHCNKRSRHHY